MYVFLKRFFTICARSSAIAEGLCDVLASVEKLAIDE